MTNTNEDLGKRIEQMLAEHVATTRKVAREAIERAFASSTVTAPIAARPVRVRESGKRRGAADLAALGDRFHRAVCSKPDETMAVLAADVRASAREL